MDILAAFGVGANRTGAREIAPAADKAADAPQLDDSQRNGFEKKFDAQRKGESPATEEADPRGENLLRAVAAPAAPRLEIDLADVLVEVEAVEEAFVIDVEEIVPLAQAAPEDLLAGAPVAPNPVGAAAAPSEAATLDEAAVLTAFPPIAAASPSETAIVELAPAPDPMTGPVEPAPSTPATPRAAVAAGPPQAAPPTVPSPARGQVGPAASDTIAEAMPLETDAPPPPAPTSPIAARVEAAPAAATPAAAAAPAAGELQPSLAPTSEKGPAGDQAVSLKIVRHAPVADHPAASDAARQVIAAIRADKSGGGFDVRLDPPELGRVRIHFSMDAPDGVVATLSSERGDTLDLMRRHGADLARELERAGFENVRLEFAANDNASFAREGSRDDAPATDSLGGEAGEGRRLVYLSMRSDNRLDRLV